MNKQKGFSHIELLIVVVILSIFAAIAVPNILRARQSQNEQSALITMRTFTEQYRGCLTNPACPIDAPPAVSGYHFALTRANGKFDLSASPDDPAKTEESASGTGRYSFYMNETTDVSNLKDQQILYAIGGVAPSRSSTEAKLISEIKR